MSSKALVIKGANFATNKVATVTLEDIIPCTGVSISQNSITFTTIGATVTLTATKTPANATDNVVWTSSDTDVATVSDGVVTCVGVGTATITASCGTKAATCAVTSQYTIVLDTAYYAENGAYYSGSMDLNAGKNHVGRMTTSRGRLFYSTEEYGTYRAFTSTVNAGKYAIPLPQGASKVKIIFPEGLETRHVAFVLENVNQKQTNVGGADGQAALGIHAFVSNNNTDTEKEIDFSTYANSANGFIMGWVLLPDSTTDITTITQSTTVVFS